LTCSSPVWELVANVPAPGSDHRKNELPALLHQFLISARVVFADRFGHMGQVEFDRAMATGLEVDEQQSDFRAENVPGVRLAMEELLGRSAVADLSSQPSQRAAQEPPVLVDEPRRSVSARNELLRIRDSIDEMRRRNIEPSHSLMQTHERRSVVGW